MVALQTRAYARDTFTAYDAVYVALAEALDLPLLTDGAKFGKAVGHRARIVHYPHGE